MKLRLQVANTLPASPKPGPADAPGKGAFGTAMEKMMAASGLGQPLLVETPYTLLQKQPQMGTHPEIAKAEQTIDESTGAKNAAKQAQIGMPFAPMPNQQAIGQSAEASPLSEEPPPEQTRPNPIDQAPPLQSPFVREPGGISLPGDPPKQLLAGATFPDAASIKNASPRAKHKTETMHDEPAQPVDGQAPPVISQPIEFVVPMSTMQAAEPAPQKKGLPAASLKSHSKAMSGSVRSQDASSRAPVPATVFGYGDLRGTPLTTMVSVTMPQLPWAVAGKGDKLPASVPSDRNSENSTKAHLAPQPLGKMNSTVAMPSNLVSHPQAAHAADVEASGQQTDTRTPKDVEKEIGSELKSEVKASVAVYATPVPPAVQHQASLNISPAGTPGAEKTIATHRPEASVAQVLQRMDIAGSSGVVPLRADPRRLDVGVSSGDLGWVEVRATTNASGRVDATLQVQNDASAQVLTSQSREISDYAREHSVQLGQVSVGVGTGDSAHQQSHSAPTRDGNGPRVKGTGVRPLADTEQTHHAGDAVSLISVRA